MSAALKFKRDALTGSYDARFTAERESGIPEVPYTDLVTVRVTPVDEFDAAKGKTVRWGWRVIVFANGTIVVDTGRSDQFETKRMASIYAKHLIATEEVRCKVLETLDDWTTMKRWSVVKHHSEAFHAMLDEYYG